jgi:hypothetical protein
MEFLRFGSSIPGAYWGCCAADIIQNFKVDPDEKASIELVGGDGGNPIPHSEGGPKFAGKTYGEIFRQRLRYGTFNSNDMPNHAFFAILTEWQVTHKESVGYKWLKILKEEGFEFIRAIDNSVYTGSKLEGKVSPKPNYLFALFRNISAGRIKDPFTPPSQWTELDQVVPEAWQTIPDGKKLATEQTEVHTKLYNELPKGVFYSRAELEKEGVPITLAGRRSNQPQQLATQREAANLKPAAASKPAPFSVAAKKSAPVTAS